MITILSNCVFMTMSNPPAWSKTVEWVLHRCSFSNSCLVILLLTCVLHNCFIDMFLLVFIPLRQQSKCCPEVSVLDRLHSFEIHGIGWISWWSAWRKYLSVLFITGQMTGWMNSGTDHCKYSHTDIKLKFLPNTRSYLKTKHVLNKSSACLN